MRRALVAFLLLSVFAAPPRLFADSVVSNNVWYEFSFTAVGTDATGCYPADPSPTALNCNQPPNAQLAPAPVWDFDITLASGTLIVTDAFLYGDSFDVYDDAVLIFSTPAATYTGSGCGGNPVVCSADPNSSHASIVLSTGPQFISIVPTGLANGNPGTGFFELVSTPEPSELPVLMLVSVFAMWLTFRKRLRRA